MKITLYLLIVLALLAPQINYSKAKDVEDDDAEVTTETDEDVEKSDDDEKNEDEEEKKPLELEDMQLWSSMDLDKDGKLTVAEYERFSRSPNAQAFIRQMKANKAMEDWASKAGMDVEKARQAMMVGAESQRRQQLANQQYYARIQAQQRRAVIARRNQQIYNARLQQQNYWSNLGRQYYQNLRRQGRTRGRNEL